MFSSIKTIIEFLRLLIDSYKFIEGQMSEAKYHSAVNSRKKNYDKFMVGDRAERLRILAEENDEK